jgi:2-polyprenyl-3-methyl-5-hydroxy-6-metoxy-1,4-benzoquinol methylase
MQMRDYVAKYDSLASEDLLFQIPFRKEYILSRVGKGKRVLDVGCLGGKFSRLMFDQNNDVWGVEANPAAAALAELRGIRVKVANVEDGIPFPDLFFHVVNAGELVENLYDTKYFFEEAHRVLQKDGLLLLTTPNLNSWENRIRVVTGDYLSMTGAYPEDHFGSHVRVFNQKKIRELCEQTGFQLIDVSGVPHLESFGKWLDTPLSWVGKFLPSFSKLLLITAQKQ